MGVGWLDGHGLSTGWSRAHQPRPAYRSDSGSVSMLMPTIASPSPRDTLAMTSGLS